jgi:uncharacterized integral membrane protein
MRVFYSIVLVLFAAVVLFFALQNLQAITVSLFSWSVTLPIALVVIGVYFLGMISGGALLAFLRGTIRRAKKTSGV